MRQLIKPLGPARLERPGSSNRRYRTALAVGLLQAEPWLARPARGGDDRGWIGRRVDHLGDARDQRSSGRAGASQRSLELAGGPEERLLRYVSPRPRAIAISPVRAISISPNGRTRRSKASTFSQVPVTSTTTERLPRSTILARNTSQTCITSARLAPSAE